MKKVLMPLPAKDFEPSEAAVPWKYLQQAGHQVTFATPSGEVATPDIPFLTGRGFGPLKVVIKTNPAGRAAYAQMQKSEALQNPIAYDDIDPGDYAAVLLPGGHAKGVRVYVEAERLQDLVAGYFDEGKLVGAICHGVLVPARATSPRTGKSPLFGRKTTCLLPMQENLGWMATRLWMGDYFKTYADRTVRSEVEGALADPGDFRAGPLPLRMDSPTRLDAGFVVVDDNYVSARWPGDAHRFGKTFTELLDQDRFG